MAKNIDLDYGDPAIEPFFDATQELLSTAITNFVPEATAVGVVVRVPLASGGEEQVGLVIEGRYRYSRDPVMATHPGGARGRYNLWAVAADNDFSGPSLEIDNTDYSFGLVIASEASGRPAGAEIARKVADVYWTGTHVSRIVPVGSSSVPQTPETVPVVTELPSLQESFIGQEVSLQVGTPNDQLLWRLKRQGNFWIPVGAQVPIYGRLYGSFPGSGNSWSDLGQANGSVEIPHQGRYQIEFGIQTGWTSSGTNAGFSITPGIDNVPLSPQDVVSTNLPARQQTPLSAVIRPSSGISPGASVRVLSKGIVGSTQYFIGNRWLAVSPMQLNV